MAELERRHSDELARAHETTARYEAAAADARANETAALERAARAEDRVETLNDQLAETAGKLQHLEAEQTSVRTQVTEAVQLADRLSAEVEILRRRAADHQVLQGEHQALKAHMAEREQRHADELAQAAERSDRQKTAVAEARAAEKAALERAARAEGQVEALKNQLADLTATLRPGAKGRSSLRGRSGNGGD